MGDFENFELRVGKGPKEGYRVRAQGVETVHDFPAPFTDGELDSLLAGAGISRDLAPVEALAGEGLQGLGRRLFESVFQEGVHRAWDELHGRILPSGKAIRLCLILEDPELWDWPWEYLNDGDFLAFSPRISIVRCPTPLAPPLPRKPGFKLQVLVVSAHPRGTSRLSFEHEWKDLENSLKGLKESGQIELRLLKRVTLASLRRELKKPCDVLHFIGHGTFSQSSRSGVLLFETKDGEQDEVTGKELAQVLRKQDRPPRLVVLNACQGGRAGQSDPFAGVAQRLAREGTAAVVAMQFKVSDKASLIFSKAFYEELAQGAAVDRAVYEARQTLLSERFETEWGNPVLYMRSPEEPMPSPAKRPFTKAAALSASLATLLGVGYWASSRPVTTSDPACPSPPKLGMSFVKIEPGEFLMGRDQRRVKITRPFCMSRFEITQKQWQDMTGLLPNQATAGEDLPVGNVSWLDVQDFLAKLNRKDRSARYRLPTEAQWEYAARAGTSGRFSFDGDETDLPRYGNCGKSGKLTPAGSFRKNPWGLHDMYGNVSEWVADWGGPLPEGPAVDPTGPSQGTEKVRRGGSFEYEKRCDSIYRNNSKPDTRDEAYGFRIVRDPIPPK